MRRRAVAGLTAAGALALAILAFGGAAEAQAASCGGLLQPPCKTASGKLCGGLLQPACPKPSSGTSGGTTTTRKNCGGLLQPRCPAKPASQCRNGVDDDKDGHKDTTDPGCTDSDDVSEYEDVAPDANGLPRGPDVDPRTAGKFFGFNTFLGLWASGMEPAQEAELIKAAGGGMQRFAVSWANIQPTSPNYHRTDRMWPVDQVYGALAARGMYPILTIIDSPVWASDASSCSLFNFACHQARQSPPEHLAPRDSAALGRFAAWLAERYPGAVIEPWNEPNINYFWGYSRFPDSGRMAAVQCAAYDHVKAVDPNRIVLSPGFAMIRSQPASGQIPYVDYLEGMHSWMGRKCWDALSVHLYPSSQVDGDGGSIAMGMRAVRNIKTRYRDTSPIWITETGASTSGGQAGDHGHTQRTDAEQAEMVRRTVNELLTTPDVGAVLLHTLRDRSSPMSYHSSPSSPQYGFGALNAESGPTPSPKPVWCHLVGVTGTAYPGCSAGRMTARAKTLRTRAVQAERTSIAVSKMFRRVR